MTLAGGAAPAEGQTKAYVANTTANVVQVIDTVAETVLATIPVGTGPTRVAITPDGARAYVSNTDSDFLSAIDTATDTVVAAIAIGDKPSALVVTPNGQQV